MKIMDRYEIEEAFEKALPFTIIVVFTTIIATVTCKATLWIWNYVASQIRV